jgi:uncharacterized protein (TIGR03067 family)
MKACLAVAVFLVAAVVGSAQDDASKKDLKRMDGTWNVVLLEVDGRKPEKNESKRIAAMNLVVKDGDYTILEDGRERAGGTVKLDATKNPKEFDAISTDGPALGLNGRTMRGIYEWKGDEMRVCLAQEGEARPKAFRTKEGSGQILLAYKRLKR